MSSILKVDQIQLANGNTPTAGDLGLNTTGNVLQVVEADGSQFVTQTVGSWQDVMSATIIPTSSSSKVLVICHYAAYGGGTGRVRANGRILRGSTSVFQSNEIFFRETSGQLKSIRTNLIELDSPSSTSAVTYKFQNFCQNCDAGQDMVIITPKITLMEIAD